MPLDKIIIFIARVEFIILLDYRCVQISTP